MWPISPFTYTIVYPVKIEELHTSLWFCINKSREEECCKSLFFEFVHVFYSKLCSDCNVRGNCYTIFEYNTSSEIFLRIKTFWLEIKQIIILLLLLPRFWLDIVNSIDYSNQQLTSNVKSADFVALAFSLPDFKIVFAFTNIPEVRAVLWNGSNFYNWWWLYERINL